MPDQKNKNKIEGDHNNTLQGISNSTININSNQVAKLPKELTLNLPKTDPDKIVGRANDLEELHRLLVNEKRVVLMNGLGGIGKTTLAQVYVTKYYDEYQHIAWISQSSENIVTDFLNDAGLIRYLGIEMNNPDPEKIFEETVLKLKAIEEKPNLLVIDNGEQSLRKYLNRLPGQPTWHLIITSREKIAGLHSRELGFLNEAEATELFKRHYTSKKFTNQDIKDLITAVDYHTLTIEILAKTAQLQRYDAAVLKQAIEKDEKANVEVSHNKEFTKIEKVGSYLSTVFNLSKLHETELWLLKQFACLPSEFHSFDLLSELLLNEESTYKESFAETVANVARKGWLFNNADKDSYKMHRIIAEVVKRGQYICKEDVKSLAATLANKLRIDQVKDNPIDKFVWVPFGRTLLASADEGSIEIAMLQNNLAMVLQDLGDYQGAKTLMEKAVLNDEKNYGTEYPSTARSYSNLATLLRDLGDYQGARILLEKAVLIDEKTFGAEHPYTAIRYSNLAMVLRVLGEYEKAMALMEKAMVSAEKTFGTEHPSTAIRYSNLATIFRDIGDYKGARILLEKAVMSDEKTFGTAHPSTARSYSNLALVLKNLGNYQEAKTLLEKAVVIAENNFGTEHLTTALSYGNLAKILQNMGIYNEALTLSEKALFILKKVLPEEHPYTAKASSIYTSIKRDMGIDT